MLLQRRESCTALFSVYVVVQINLWLTNKLHVNRMTKIGNLSQNV